MNFQKWEMPVYIYMCVCSYGLATAGPGSTVSVRLFSLHLLLEFEVPGTGNQEGKMGVKWKRARASWGWELGG